MSNFPEDFPISEAKLIEHVQSERSQGTSFVNNKRALFRNRNDLYNNISDETDDRKIYSRLIFTVVDTLLSIYYTDQITVDFAGRQLNDDEQADNIQNVAKFDQEEMELDKLNYDTQWNRLFYGVGIRILDGWDEDRKVPVFQNIEPLSWVCDPYGYIDNHRFHGFDTEINEAEVEALKEDEDNGYIKDALDKIKPGIDAEKRQTKERRNDNRRFNSTDNEKGVNPLYNIYTHFTTIKGHKYRVVMGNGDKIVISVEEIEPVTKAEKKNPALVKFPVVLNFYSPMKGDPFGVSICDILEDKQKAQQLFLNLNRIKAENSAWGDTFLVDTDAVQNLTSLKTPTLGPKFVPANLRENPNPIQEVSRSTISQDAVNMPVLIDNQAQLDLGLDTRSLGVSGAGNITASESQRVQQNANTRLILKNKINAWGEKDFWTLWRRSYIENFKGGAQKNIRLNNAFGSIVYTISSPDISTTEDINITIVNQSDKEAMEDKQRQGFIATAPMVLADPNKPAISKAFLERKLQMLNGATKDEAMVLVPPSPEETNARLDVHLLNEDETPGPIEDMDEDHMTYLVIYSKAIDTPAKRKAIEARTRAYIASGQVSQQQQEPGGAQTALASSNASQMTAQVLGGGQQGQQSASIADVAQ